VTGDCHAPFRGSPGGCAPGPPDPEIGPHAKPLPDERPTVAHIGMLHNG
jgi:hypothetical protein